MIHVLMRVMICGFMCRYARSHLYCRALVRSCGARVLVCSCVRLGACAFMRVRLCGCAHLCGQNKSEGWL